MEEVDRLEAQNSRLTKRIKKMMAQLEEQERGQGQQGTFLGGWLSGGSQELERCVPACLPA